MRVLEAAIGALVSAILLTFVVHRLHVQHVDLVSLWAITFLVMFVVILVSSFNSRSDRR